VFLGDCELCGKCGSRHDWCNHVDQGETQAGDAFCRASYSLCHSPVRRRFVWLGMDGILSPTITRDATAAFMLYAQGLLPFLLPLSVLLFEPGKRDRRRMLPFLVIGGATMLYVLWGLTAYSFEVHVRENSIVYENAATNNDIIAGLYLVATCGSLFFSKVRRMVVFGAVNLLILLVVMAVKRYAFTSMWCAYAAAASLIVLVYFWKSAEDRPFRYSEALW
jgi:hypothetical protein